MMNDITAALSATLLPTQNLIKNITNVWTSTHEEQAVGTAIMQTLQPGKRVMSTMSQDTQMAKLSHLLVNGPHVG
jgi:hypothetical protein